MGWVVNKYVKIAGGLAVALVVLVIVGVGGIYMWATSATSARLAVVYTPHTIDIPVPFPLSKSEIEALRAEKEAALGDLDPDAEPEDVLKGVDLDALAKERAIARGKHLVEARFACVECHGRDFSGGVMVDDGAMGTWLGPNLTQGEGSRAKGFAIADWDRIVRHGVKKEGTAGIMPSEDFVGMSDRELSDIVVYIGTFSNVDNTVPAPTFGPIGTMLMATAQLPLSAEHHADYTEHITLPPQTEPTATFGKHLVQVCTGCHRADLSGGPIPIGPPDWPPAGNLTPHADGLEGWTFEQFDALMTKGEKADGSELLEPMTLMMPYASEMTEVEMKALWAYLQSLEAKPTGT